MKQYPFIFSAERRYRLQRHAAFWMFWFVFQGFLYAFLPGPMETDYWRRLPQSMLGSLLFLPNHMLLSYSLMYFVIPFYIVRNKYAAAAGWTCAFVVLAACVSSVISIFIIPPARELVLPNSFVVPQPREVFSKEHICLALMAGLRGGLTVAGLAAAIKLMKHWYVQEQRTLQLQKEAVEAQLQVLKAQIHPHFMFNTLNNIYAHTQATSPEAAKMVMGLSDMLRYMLYECNHSLVPLSKELQLINDYIELEKIRYGNRLELHVDVPEREQQLSIAPLLLLPFVENCFKHGISNILDQPWLSLHVHLSGRTMTMKLLNSKPPGGPSAQAPGIGIENVRRRLELLYPGRHELTINSEDDIFIVNLKLELERRKVPVSIPAAQAPVLVGA